MVFSVYPSCNTHQGGVYLCIIYTVTQMPVIFVNKKKKESLSPIFHVQYNMYFSMRSMYKNVRKVRHHDHYK